MNVDGRLKSDVEWQFKVQAVLPAAGRVPGLRELHATATARTSCGARARCATITHVPENTPILLQPRGENGRLEDVTILDIRLQKDFRLGEKVRLALIGDAFNLLNSDTTEGVMTSLVES